MAKTSAVENFRVVNGYVKFLVILTHVILLISAMVMVGLTIYCVYVEQRDFEAFKSDPMMTPLRELIYTSAGLGVIAFGIGVKGACTEHTPALIVSYAAVLAVIALINIAAGSSALNTAQQRTSLRKALEKHLEEYETYDDDKDRAVMDDLQRKMKCCGVKEYKDWQGVTFGRTTLRTPPSCCLAKNLVYPNGRRMKPGTDEYDLCGQNVLPEDPDAKKLVHTRGCLDIASEEFRKYLNINGIFVLSFGLIEGTIVSCIIAMIIKKKI